MYSIEDRSKTCPGGPDGLAAAERARVSVALHTPLHWQSTARPPFSPRRRFSASSPRPLLSAAAYEARAPGRGRCLPLLQWTRALLSGRGALLPPLRSRIRLSPSSALLNGVAMPLRARMPAPAPPPPPSLDHAFAACSRTPCPYPKHSGLRPRPKTQHAHEASAPEDHTPCLRIKPPARLAHAATPCTLHPPPHTACTAYSLHRAQRVPYSYDPPQQPIQPTAL